MKLSKSWFVIVAVALCLTARTVCAEDKAQVLKQASEKLDPLLNESQLREMGDNVGLFKKAGLSYQPSLVVPVEGVVGCKDKEQLRMLMGMYTFDANYALVFGKKQAFAAANWQRENLDRLTLAGKLNLKTFTPEELKKVLDNPDDPANRDLYVKYVAANAHNMVEAAKSDQEMLVLYLDFSYGAVVQGLYVACKLARAAGTNDQRLVALFNEQSARLNRVYQAMEAYAGNPELDALTKRSQREAVLKPVAEILKTNKGNLTEEQVVEILSWVEPERRKVVGKCE